MQNIIMIVVFIHAIQYFISFLFTEIGAFNPDAPGLAAIFKLSVTI
jgi:hypothetical protein